MSSHMLKIFGDSVNKPLGLMLTTPKCLPNLRCFSSNLIVLGYVYVLRLCLRLCCMLLH